MDLKDLVFQQALFNKNLFFQFLYISHIYITANQSLWLE